MYARSCFSVVLIVAMCCILLPQSQQTQTFTKPQNTGQKTSCVSPDKYNRKPIVMIPGVLGSQLEAKLNKPDVVSILCSKNSDWFSLWLNLDGLLPFLVDCWVDNIKMLYNNETKQVRNNYGVQTRVPRFGSTYAFEYLDKDKYAIGSLYFAPLVDHMTCNLGYTKQKDLFGAPFDWRLSPLQHKIYFKKLGTLIETAYYNNNNTKVVVMGHSMGNMFMYYYLKQKTQAWKDKFIDSFVSISSPYFGSVKSLKALLSGETEGHDWVLPKLKLRNAVRTAPAFTFVLPNPDLWPHNKDTIVVTIKQNFTVFQYKDLFKRIGCEGCWDLWKENGKAIGKFTPPKVPVHCVYSSLVPTPEVLMYDEDLFPDQSPSMVDGDGDGTVNKFSGSACLKWKTMQTQPIYDVPMPGNKHVQILGNKTLHNYLNHVVLR
ncbi:lysosomal phospholipase A and acyltransferase-like [Ciona intestinalis]